MLKIMTRATEKTKRSWTYMRENGVDSPYLFLHLGFSMVASLGHPELFVEKKKMLKKVWSYTVDFCIRFRTIRDNPT